MRLDHNRGAYYPNARAVNMPYGLYAQDNRLIFADVASSRLTGDLDDVNDGRQGNAARWPRRLRSEGRQSLGPTARDSMRWSYGVAACGSTPVIDDSGNDTGLLWEASP
jgi:hypothetical protein